MDDREGFVNPLANTRERNVLHAALDSFRQYRHVAHYNVTHIRRQSFYSLPNLHMDVLTAAPFKLPEVFRRVDDAIDQNAEIAEGILNVGLSSCGLNPTDESWQGTATPADMDKARSTIRQLYRDWSAAGASERKACYGPILKALEKHLPQSDEPSRRQPHRILVPGSGLGRLVYELCLEGYDVEGNEISYHQSLASNYFINYVSQAEKHTLFPWALSFSNHTTRANQLRGYAVPDIHPLTDLVERQKTTNNVVHFGERMCISTGDFCTVYRRPAEGATFDAVTTCFFIDTAPNLINYIDTVYHCLREGGLWVNVGPLLWHFENNPTPAEQGLRAQVPPDGEVDEEDEEGIGAPGSFELADEEVRALVEMSGFDVLEQGYPAEAHGGYIQDPDSMLQNTYRPSVWVARKVEKRGRSVVKT